MHSHHGPRHLAARLAQLTFLLGLMLAAPQASAIPTLPNINLLNVVNVTNAAYGAVGDGVTTNTTAIQKAITAAAAGGTTNGAAGGTVEIPPGVYMCGPLTMANSVNLQIDAGAILRMLPLGQYPGGTTSGTTFISASNLHDIEISGSGAIDGQGEPWWPYANTNGALRPIMIGPSDCNRLLIQNVTLSNSPMFHIAISGSHSGNSTVQNVTVRAPSSTANPPSHNTDACDVAGTNILVENCNISTGDDDFTCGGPTSNVLLTNNIYGNGHGVSIGSYTDDGGVSNITVINCIFNGTQNGIRIKSDNDRGGLVQNINYFNLGMTNVDLPIQVYAYYNEVGTPSSISPQTAAGETVDSVSSTTPAYRNITFSNITATSVSGYPVGIIWARIEMPATNIVFNKINLTGDRNFCLYNVNGAQFINSSITVSPTSNTFALFNARVIVTNTTLATGQVTLAGVSTNGYENQLNFYNTQAAFQDTNLLAHGPLLLSQSTLAVTNDLTMYSDSVFTYGLGANPSELDVIGNLTLGGAINLTNAAGIAAGTYPLISYTGSLSGTLPALGGIPAGSNCALSTNTPGLVNLVVSPPAPAAPTNLTATAANLAIVLNWYAVPGATNYNIARSNSASGTFATIASTPGTNYTDYAVSNGVEYYYQVSAVNSGGESTNSATAGATPLPATPPQLILQNNGGQIQLSWPSNYLGWRLEIQTNALNQGLGTNWFAIPGSQVKDQITLPLVVTNGSVFLRLIYP